jgi:SAM-dependent methyltransferase
VSVDLDREFSRKNYLVMHRARGIKLPVNYFLECHLFDIIHGTDTHNWVQKRDYDEVLGSLAHGTFYMCSWSSEIKNAYKFTRNHLQSKFDDFVMVDVGCGKGKVVLVWETLSKNACMHRPVGIDYSSALVQIARENYKKLFQRDGSFLCSDILSVDLEQYGRKFIFYIANPFDEIIMENFLSRISHFQSMIIYTNPIYAGLIQKHGFELVHRKEGWHPMTTTDFFSRNIS